MNNANAANGFYTNTLTHINAAKGSVYTNTYTLINTSNNNKHAEKEGMIMHIYKRSQKNSLKGENKNFPSRERSLD